MKPTKEHIATARHIGDSVLSTAREADHMHYEVDDLVSDLEGQIAEINDLIAELKEYERQQLAGENPNTLRDALENWRMMTIRQQTEFLKKVEKK